MTKAGVEVLGISPDSATRHDKWVEKECIPFTLLSDEDRQVAEKYGVLQEKNMYGKKVMGIARSTFVIDKNGKVAKVFEKVKPAGHSQEVLDWVLQNL